jgi:acyl carrier protein
MTTYEIVKNIIVKKGYMPASQINQNTNLFEHMGPMAILDVVSELQEMLNTPIQEKYFDNVKTVRDMVRAYQAQSRANLNQDLKLTYQQLRTLVPVRAKQANFRTR